MVWGIILIMLIGGILCVIQCCLKASGEADKKLNGLQEERLSENKGDFQ